LLAGALLAVSAPAGAAPVDKTPPPKEANPMSPPPAGPEATSQQALVDAFRTTVRYALLKTRRDVATYGVSPSRFTPEALAESLRAKENADAFSDPAAPSVLSMVKRTEGGPVTLLFRWQPAEGQTELRAAFRLTKEPHAWDVRLLWLELPQKVPVAPSVGEIDGQKPIEEAVFQKLELRPDGSVAAFPKAR
jgi:hypothetical protein